MSHRVRGRLAGVAALGGLLGLTLLFFWKIAFTNRVLVGLDVFTYFYPYRDAVSEALRAGRLPLWNPYLFMGAPLLANSQAAVLYPPHWLLLWLSPPKQVAWSIVGHVWLAGAGSYLFCRRALDLERWPALAAALVFALGGFIGAQVEHINQLNASAWLPWLLLAVEQAGSQPGKPSSATWRLWPVLAGAVVTAMMLLAGHTQAAYIGLAGTAVWSLLRDVGRPFSLRRLIGGRLGALVVMAVAGLALAAAQLLPTLELSRLSVRGGGLDYREAVSFSLKPGLVFKAFLPPFLWEPPFSEYVAYVGLLGLAFAAVGGWQVLRRGRSAPAPDVSRVWAAALLLAGLGLFLAFGGYNPLYYILYKLVPGIALFRAPARWLLLYSFGAALLAGAGLQALQLANKWRIGLVLLLAVELFAAGRRLAYNQPTAPAAYDSMRSAPAHLLAYASTPSRFMSLSDILFDPGDLGDLQAMYGPELPEKAVYDLIVATKMKEVLAFNLPLRYRLFSVDGYDGGLLPVTRYVTLERLFLDEEEIWPDGRLRQQLRQVPPARLLSLLNVEHVITDKTQDVWIDGVYYDLEHTLPLGQVVLDDLPDFAATELGVVSYLSGTVGLSDGAPVATVTVTDTGGTVYTATLRAGDDTAEGRYGSAPVAHQQARVGHGWRDDPQGSDYVTRLDLAGALRPAGISVRSLLPAGGPGRFYLRGLTLIDGRTGTSRNLTVDPAYRLVHSGDVKIYQNREVLPRARIVYRARAAADDEEALSFLQNPDVNPADETVITGGEALEGGRPGAAAEIVAYDAEQVSIKAALEAPGYLVLSDAYYPGWQATVDGQAAPIVPADLYFRGVYLEAGAHTVTMRFEPATVRIGLAVSAAAWLLLVLAAAVLALRIGRRSKTDV